MASYNRSNFKTAKNNAYSDSLPAGATVRETHRDILEDAADSMMFLDDNFVDEDDFASDSATKAPSQQSVKAYVDNKNSYLNNGNGLERKVVKVDNWNDVTMAASASTSATVSDAEFTIIQNNSMWEIEIVFCGVKTDYSAAFTARRKGVWRRDGTTTTFVGHDAAMEVVGTADVTSITFSGANSVQLVMTAYSGASYKVSAYAVVSRFTT